MLPSIPQNTIAISEHIASPHTHTHTHTQRKENTALQCPSPSNPKHCTPTPTRSPRPALPVRHLGDCRAVGPSAGDLCRGREEPGSLRPGGRYATESPSVPLRWGSTQTETHSSTNEKEHGLTIAVTHTPHPPPPTDRQGLQTSQLHVNHWG